MKSMQGMMAAKIEDSATKKATAIAKLQSLEESNVQFDTAIKAQLAFTRDHNTNEDESSMVMANILLKDSDKDINVIMKQLLPYWALFSHNQPLQFNSQVAFSHWAEQLFNEHIRSKLEPGGHKQFLEDVLAGVK